MKSVTRSEGCGCGQRGRLAMRRAKGTKDPNRPKLPMSAFFHFLAKFRQEYMVEHPNIKMSTVINKAGGEKWRRMSKADQAPYKAEFDRAMKAYRDAGHMEVGNVPPHADDPEVGHAAAAAAADHELGLAAPVAAAAADQELGLAAAADHELGLAAPVAAAAADQELGLAAAVATTNHDLGHANDDDHELGHAAADDHELVYAAVAATNHDLGTPTTTATSWGTPPPTTTSWYTPPSATSWGTPPTTTTSWYTLPSTTSWYTPPSTTSWGSPPPPTTTSRGTPPLRT